jgi:hypothetical protein
VTDRVITSLLILEFLKSKIPGFAAQLQNLLPSSSAVANEVIENVGRSWVFESGFQAP